MKSILENWRKFLKEGPQKVPYANPEDILKKVFGFSRQETKKFADPQQQKKFKTTFRKLLSSYHPDKHEQTPEEIEKWTKATRELVLARDAVLNPRKFKFLGRSSPSFAKPERSVDELLDELIRVLRNIEKEQARREREGLDPRTGKKLSMWNRLVRKLIYGFQTEVDDEEEEDYE